MKKFRNIVVLLVLFCAQTFAQQDGVPFGTFTAFPTIGISYGYDDNFLYAPDGSNYELSSGFFVISPGVRLETEGDRTDLMLQLDYNKTFYREDSRYNFDMWHLLADFGYHASSRSIFRLTAEYFDGSDRIGTGNQQGNIIGLGLDPDEWHSFGLGGKWHYGGIGSRGAIDLELGLINRDYDNNRVFTRTRDRDTRYIGLTYSHNISPRTSLLAQIRYTDIDYEVASLDNTETRLMFGAEWQAGSKTKARALVGWLEKDFDDNLRDDYSGLALEAGVTWFPRSYSNFDLSLARETDETNGNGSYIIRNSADLGWNHFWQDRFNTTLNIGYSQQDYQEDIRDDNLRYYGLSAKYLVNNYISTGLGWRHYDRNSTFDEFEYKDNTLLFTVEFSK